MLQDAADARKYVIEITWQALTGTTRTGVAAVPEGRKPADEHHRGTAGVPPHVEHIGALAHHRRRVCGMVPMPKRGALSEHPSAVGSGLPFDP